MTPELMEWEEILKLLQTGGLVTLLFAIVVAFLRGWLIPGWMYTKVQKDLDDANGRYLELAKEAIAQKLIARR